MEKFQIDILLRMLKYYLNYILNNKGVKKFLPLIAAGLLFYFFAFGQIINTSNSPCRLEEKKAALIDSLCRVLNERGYTRGQITIALETERLKILHRHLIADRLLHDETGNYFFVECKVDTEMIIEPGMRFRVQNSGKTIGVATATTIDNTYIKLRFINFEIDVLSFISNQKDHYILTPIHCEFVNEEKDIEIIRLILSLKAIYCTEKIAC